MRTLLRKSLTWIFASIVVVILVAVVGEWFIEVARAKGWYDNAGARWDSIMGAVSDFATSALVLYPLTALGGMVAGLWLDKWAKPVSAPDLQDGSSVPVIAIDQKAFDDLELFVVEHLMPACYSLIRLQEKMIEKSGAAAALIEIAKGGLLSDWRLREFSEGMDVLSGFGDSPTRIPSAEAMVDAVDKIEKNYQFLCEQASAISKDSHAQFGADPQIDEAYEQWRRQHNAAIVAYDRIKKDPRFKRDEILKKLHRPIRQTRLGKPVGDITSGKTLLIVPPVEATVVS